MAQSSEVLILESHSQRAIHKSAESILHSKTFWIIAGTALSTLAAYGLYSHFINKNKTLTPSGGQSVSERAKNFIKHEMKRLQNPTIIDGDANGLLQKKDFFDLLMIIQLKSKIKLQKEVGRNQRDRVKLLEYSLNGMNSMRQPLSESQENQVRNSFEGYIDRLMDIMQKEFEEYEDQFQKILTVIGISNDTWEASRELYITRAADYTNEEIQDGKASKDSIESIDKRIYEYLPQANIPKSLTREKAKSIMIDVNHRSSLLFKTYMRAYVQDNHFPEYEPLMMETLAFDLAFIEYSINENVFRFASYKYQLQQDPEVKEYLDEYLSN